MNFNEFAETIKAKHPEYKDKDNLELAKAVVAKYPQYAEKVTFDETPPIPKDTSMMDVAKMGVQAALPSSEATTPITPISGNPVMGAVEAAGQTLRDPTRISPTLSQPGQKAAETLADVTEAQGLPHPLAKALEITQAIKNDPQTYILGEPTRAAVESVSSGFKSVKNFVKNLFTKPATEEELASVTKEVSDTLVQARQKVGAKLGEMRGTHEEALDRLGRIAEKGPEAELKPQDAAKMYQDYFKSRAPLMEEAGMSAPEGVKKPDIEVYVKGTMGGGISPNTGKPLPKVKIYGVKGNPDLIKAEFGEANPGSVPEHILKQKGLLPEHVVEGPQFASQKEELQYLIKMRSSMKDQISKRTMDQQGNMVKAISSDDERAFSAGIKKINERIESLPGGKDIRAQEKKFSELAGIYDDLQAKLKNPNEAREFLRRIFMNPKGKNLDYLNKLKKLEELAGTNIIGDLQKAFESTKGLTYEQLKHPIASSLKALLPNVGNIARGAVNVAVPPTVLGLKGLQTPFNTSEMQSLRDKLRNAK